MSRTSSTSCPACKSARVTARGNDSSTRNRTGHQPTTRTESCSASQAP
jgi:hypothetical protein